MSIRIGIGGWTYAPWRGVFYPKGLAQKRELEHASRQLTAIEINGTFYGRQSPESFAKWHDETPDDFVFTLKAPRFCTHRKILAEAGESIGRFFESGVARLGAKLGPINWQFPTTRKFEAESFAAFLDLLPAEHDGLGLRHAVELRHESFACPEAVAIARERGVAIVIAGDSEHPLIPDPTANFAYLRIMGTEEAEPEGYPSAALDAWAGRAAACAEGGTPKDWERLGPAAKRSKRDVFLFVIGGGKVRNPAAARALIERLEGVK